LSAIKESRPEVKIPFSTLQKSLIFLAIAGFLLSLALIAVYWQSLPAKVPRHFGVTGNADAWGTKGNLLILPIIALPILVLLVGLSFVPHTFNYTVRITAENASYQYSLARTMILALCAEIIWIELYITWGTIRVAMGQATGLGQLFVVIMLAATFATVGIFFCLARRYR
jgi:uncharacterized membrane protein